MAALVSSRAAQLAAVRGRTVIQQLLPRATHSGKLKGQGRRQLRLTDAPRPIAAVPASLASRASTHVHAGHAAPRRTATWAQRRQLVAAAAAADVPPADSTSTSLTAPAGFASLEKLIATQLGGGPGGDWREVEG